MNHNLNRIRSNEKVMNHNLNRILSNEKMPLMTYPLESKKILPDELHQKFLISC